MSHGFTGQRPAIENESLMKPPYVVAIWSSDALLSENLRFALQRLGHPHRRIQSSDEIFDLPNDDKLILIVGDDIPHAEAIRICAELSQRRVVVPIFLRELSIANQIGDLPSGAFFHPCPIDLKELHQLVLQIAQT